MKCVCTWSLVLVIQVNISATCWFKPLYTGKQSYFQSRSWSWSFLRSLKVQLILIWDLIHRVIIIYILQLFHWLVYYLSHIFTTWSIWYDQLIFTLFTNWSASPECTIKCKMSQNVQNKVRTFLSLYSATVNELFRCSLCRYECDVVCGAEGKQLPVPAPPPSQPVLRPFVYLRTEQEPLLQTGEREFYFYIYNYILYLNPSHGRNMNACGEISTLNVDIRVWAAFRSPL